MSLPTRERGLKLKQNGVNMGEHRVAPYTGAWIEISLAKQMINNAESLPTRERGLKLIRPRIFSTAARRSLHGSVD